MNGGDVALVGSREGQSQSLISSLSKDAMLHVFTRLPDVRSAIRCSLVCKHWLSLISSPDFRKHHESQSNHLPCTLVFKKTHTWANERSVCHFVTTDTTCSNSSLDFLPCPQVRILSTCDDLLLLWPDSKKCLIICNPFTKQWIELPQYLEYGHHAQFAHCALVCKPQQYSVTKLHQCRFKVILIIYKGTWDPRNLSYITYAYCSESKEWTESTFRLIPSKGSFVTTNLSVACSDGMVYRLLKNSVIVFDPFKDANHCTIDIPFRYSRFLCIGTVRGRLWLSQFWFENERKTYVLKVWELSDGDGDGDGPWTLVKDVELKKIEFDSSLRFINFHPDDGDVIFFKDGHGVYIHEYHIAEEKFTKIGTLPPRDSYFAYILRRPLWPTLLPI